MDKTSTALVVIDLQKGIVHGNRALAPHSAEEVVRNATRLIENCRANNIPVILVRVQPGPGTALKPESDTTMQMRAPEADWAELVIAAKQDDILITKKQWGAFYGTDLELQLRRRRIGTIILCGISTNIGVESTARFAYEFGFNQIFAEDAMTAMSEGEHSNSINNIFKRIGKVRKTEEVLEEIRGS